MVYEKLLKIQKELNVPKSNYNSFGKYKYRSCEDILEALKPLLVKNNVTLSIKDDIVMVGDRYYIKATAKLVDCETGESVEVSALAREEENKKGMDASQITGSTSSYARKYALNGLFCIDDTKDADATNKHGKEEKELEETIPASQAKTLEDTINMMYKEGKLNMSLQEILEGYKVTNLKNLTKGQAGKLKIWLAKYGDKK